jgi:ABC-2 type transport system permease protein
MIKELQRNIDLTNNRLSGRIRRIKALIIKEFYQIIRDPSSILISVGLPLLLMFVYGFGVSLDLNHLRIGLVLEDTSPDAQNFAASLTNSRYFDVKIVRDRRELTDDIIRGNIRGFVVVPSYFSQFRNRKDQVAPIQVIADGSETNTANFVQNYVTGAWQQWLQEEKLMDNLKGLPLINVQARFWYNEELESRLFLIPGSLAIIMTLIGTLLTALVVSREWERGTMEALMSTPVRIGELLLGKLIPYFILGMGSMTICVLIAVFFYEVPLRGSFLVILLVSGVFLISALGLGLLISTLTKNQFSASQAAIVTAFLPSYILSGFLFEISSMPPPIRLLTYIIPARYFVSSLQTLFLVGNVWSLILYNLIPMLLVGLLFFLVTARKTVKRLD